MKRILFGALAAVALSVGGVVLSQDTAKADSSGTTIVCVVSGGVIHCEVVTFQPSDPTPPPAPSAGFPIFVFPGDFPTLGGAVVPPEPGLSVAEKYEVVRGLR